MVRYVVGGSVAAALALGGTAAAAAVRDGVPVAELPGAIGERIVGAVSDGLAWVGVRHAEAPARQADDPEGPGVGSSDQAPGRQGSEGPGVSDQAPGHQSGSEGPGVSDQAPGHQSGSEGPGVSDQAPGSPVRQRGSGRVGPGSGA